jgi:hypothetical protein
LLRRPLVLLSRWLVVVLPLDAPPSLCLIVSCLVVSSSRRLVVSLSRHLVVLSSRCAALSSYCHAS